MAVVKTYVVPKRVFPRLDLNRHALATDRAKKLTKSTHTEGNRYFGAYRNGIGLCSEDFFVQLVDKQRADPSKSGESAKTGYGWRMALLPAAAVMAVLAILAAVLAVDRPADVGIAPLGEDAVQPNPAPPQGNALALSLEALRLALATPMFQLLAFTFFVCGVSSFGLMPHFVTLCGDFGIGPV